MEISTNYIGRTEFFNLIMPFVSANAPIEGTDVKWSVGDRIILRLQVSRLNFWGIQSSYKYTFRSVFLIKVPSLNALRIYRFMTVTK